MRKRKVAKVAILASALVLSLSVLAAEPEAAPAPSGSSPVQMSFPVAGSSATLPPPAPAATPGLLERAAASAQGLADSALAFLGVSYRFGGNSPEGGFDCSGLVRRVFQDALGLNLPRTAKEMSQVGKQVSIEDLKPGDLVFFNTMRRAFSHVGIYLGNSKFVHAPSDGGVVRVEDIRIPYWTSRFNGARRMADENQTKSN